MKKIWGILGVGLLLFQAGRAEFELEFTEKEQLILDDRPNTPWAREIVRQARLRTPWGQLEDYLRKEPPSSDNRPFPAGIREWQQEKGFSDEFMIETYTAFIRRAQENDPEGKTEDTFFALQALLLMEVYEPDAATTLPFLAQLVRTNPFRARSRALSIYLRLRQADILEDKLIQDIFEDPDLFSNGYRCTVFMQLCAIFNRSEETQQERILDKIEEWVSIDHGPNMFRILDSFLAEHSEEYRHSEKRYHLFLTHKAHIDDPQYCVSRQNTDYIEETLPLIKK